MIGLFVDDLERERVVLKGRLANAAMLERGVIVCRALLELTGFAGLKAWAHQIKFAADIGHRLPAAMLTAPARIAMWIAHGMAGIHAEPMRAVIEGALDDEGLSGVFLSGPHVLFPPASGSASISRSRRAVRIAAESGSTV